MASTYTPIATTTLGSDTGIVTFSSISGSYTDLILVSKTAKNGGGAGTLRLQFNSDTGSNYSYVRMYANGTNAYSDASGSETGAGVAILGDVAIASAGTFIVQLQNYSNSSTYKTAISRGSDSDGGYVSAYVSLWRSTSAINRIDIYSTTNLRSGSTFTLYGIKAA